MVLDVLGSFGRMQILWDKAKYLHPGDVIFWPSRVGNSLLNVEAKKSPKFYLTLCSFFVEVRIGPLGIDTINDLTYTLSND